MAAQIINLSVGLLAGAGQKQRLANIINIIQISFLGAVAVYLNFVSFHRLADKPTDKSLAIMFYQLPRTINIGHPQRSGADAVNIIVKNMIPFAGIDINAINVGWLDRMIFVDWQIE